MLEFPRSSSLRDSRECSEDSHWPLVRAGCCCCRCCCWSPVATATRKTGRGPLFGQFCSLARLFSPARSLFPPSSFLWPFPGLAVTPAGRKFRAVSADSFLGATYYVSAYHLSSDENAPGRDRSLPLSLLALHRPVASPMTRY